MPPNQFAHVTSCTPGVDRIVSVCDDGMLKIIDVERIVTTRVAELAAETESKPSSTARSAANRKTAIATLITVSSVRRLLRLALLTMRPMNFMRAPVLPPACLFQDGESALPARPRAGRASP